MRHTYEPLETMNIPVGEHSLYTSIVIAMLAPLDRDEDAFGDAFDELFPGRKMTTKRRDLRQAFVTMTGDEIPTILSELVRDYLIPAFTRYCGEQVLGLKDSADETDNEACIVENMAAMLAVTITCHTPDRVDSAGVMCEAYPKPGQGLHILKQEKAWQPLLTRDVLARIKNNASNTEDEINPIGTDACPAFEGMVHSGMQVILNSSKGLKVASLNDPMFLTSRTILYSDQSNCALEVRYNNLVAMTKAVKSDLTRVNLDTLQTHPEPWEGAEITGAGRGALVGVILAGALELGVAFEVGAAAASTALIGTVPLAVLLTILGVGVGVVGKKASKEYCQALVKATDYLNDQRYFEAAKVLDAEFATSTLTQWARSGFLSHEHQALAHMYRAICEEGIEASPPPNLEKPASRAIAYQHYTQAADYAKKANREFLHFISHLCRLKLLKKSTSEQLEFKATTECTAGVVHKKELDKTLQELTEQYRHGFQDLYYKLNTSMINLLEAFSPGRCIGTQHVSAANTFLKFDDFYLLQYVNEGRGALVDLLGLCVQGVLLAKLHQTHPTESLEPETKNQFILKFGNSNPRNEILNLALACEKISEAAKLLSALKTQYAEQIAKDERLKNGLLCIADFMLYFHAHCHDNGRFFKDAYKNIIKILAVPEARAKQILAYVQYTIELLNRIKTHKRVLSIPDWFSALEQDQAGFNNNIDPDTGDTMLHFLTRMPLTDDADVRTRIKSIAKQLKNQAYVRNNAHETPLFALKANDPYGIAAEIFPESTPSDRDSLKVFDNPATTDLPSFDGRKKLLQHQFREKRISEQNIHNLANSMDGFSSVELEETVAPIDASIIDINDEYATKMVDYCKIKKKPFSYILDLIKKAIWNDCDGYISSKATVARSLDSYMSGKKSSYKENVRKSLEIVFNDPAFQGLIREYYDRIQESTIPKSREKSEYLTSLVAIQDEDPARRLLALKEFCKEVKHVAIHNSQSKFAELIGRYIENAWLCVSLQPKITNSNVVFFRPIREGTAENPEKLKFDIIDTKMKTFKTAFVHYLDKTYRLFAVLTRESVNRKRDDVINSFSTMIKSTEVKVGVSVPFVGGMEANISSVIAGIIDLFQMASEYLDRQKMQMLCHCFPEDETERFEAVILSGLKLSAELSPELYHMPDEAIIVLAELVVTRIVSYMTRSEHNNHEIYPNFVERVITDVHAVFSTKISSSPVKRKDLITICQDGMRTSRGNHELSKVSKKVSSNKKDSPTYQDILDHHGKIIVQENGEIGFIQPKRGQAYCMAQPSKEKVVSQTDAHLPARLEVILDVCIEVYSAEMGNNNPIIPENIFSHRRQYQQPTRVEAGQKIGIQFEGVKI